MRRLSVLLPVLALLLIGCPGGGSGPAGEPGPEVAPATMKIEPLLRYRFTADDSVRMRTTLDLVAKLGAMGELNTKQSEETTWVVEEVAADGTASITVTYDSIKLDMLNPMTGPVAYDSTAENAAEMANNPAAAGPAALIGKSVQIGFAPGGQLTSVSGYDAIMAAVGAGNPAMQGAGALLADDTQKSRMQLSFPRFPKEVMEKGEQWTVPGEMSLPMGGSIAFDMKYTLDDMVEAGETTVALLSYVAEVSAEDFVAPEADPDNPMSAMLSQMKVSGGKLTGAARFDMMKGRIDRTDYEMTLTMQMMGMDIESTTKVAQERFE